MLGNILHLKLHSLAKPGYNLDHETSQEYIIMNCRVPEANIFLWITHELFRDEPIDPCFKKMLVNLDHETPRFGVYIHDV